MTNTQSLEPSPDAIIQGLHQIREVIVDSFQGDLQALTDGARRRERESGRKTWRPASALNSAAASQISENIS